jgi:hypothetical protein
MGPGGDQLLTPSLQFFLLLKQYILYLFIRSVENAYMLCSVRICKHLRESKSTCSRCTGGPGRLSAPSPRSVGGAGGEGGGRLASHVLPGGSWAGKGGSLACEFGGLCSRVDLACFHGKTFWRVCLAGLFGGSSWLIHLAGFQSKGKRMLLNNEKK